MLLLWTLAGLAAHAVTLTPGAITPISTGVTVQEYRISNPGTDVYVARIDLCQSGIYLDADRDILGDALVE